MSAPRKKRKRKHRPSVSMTASVHRRMAFAAEASRMSKSAWLAEAIEEKLERDGFAPETPDGWEPKRGKGGPSRPALRQQTEGEFHSGVKHL